MSHIQNDSYWFVEGEKEDAQIMQIMCLKCHDTHPFGWLWEGSKLGYGDYDTKCHYCGVVLHQRNETYEETTASV